MADSRVMPLSCLIVLVLSGIVHTVGVGIPWWVTWGTNMEMAGLWDTCVPDCRRLEYDDFFVEGINEREMPAPWIATQGLICTGMACILVAVIAYIIWIVDWTNRNAGLTAVCFHFLAGVFGTCGVIVFGVYWGALPNGFAYWMAVGGAAFILLVGLICTIVEVCTCDGVVQKRYLRRAIMRPASDTIPVVKTVPRAQVPIAVPIAHRPVEVIQQCPAIEPAPSVIINTNTKPCPAPDELTVTAVYNGPAGGCHDTLPVCDTGFQQHSATVYVDSCDSRCYSTMDGSNTYQSGTVFRY